MALPHLQIVIMTYTSPKSPVPYRFLFSEKLYSKIAGYSNENSIKLILDILYSCYFNLMYDDNLARRIAISKQAEVGRESTLEIMKEDNTQSGT